MTSPIALAALMALSALFIASMIGWALAALASRLLCSRPRLVDSAPWLLAHTRLLPLTCAAILVPAQLRAFAAYEVGGAESAGILLLLTGFAGLALLLDAVYGGATTWRDTMRVMRAWKATAAPLVMRHWTHRAWAIRPAFPVVAVVGVLRPQLFVARQVLDGCTRDELAAIAAHEAAHGAARDNLVRLLFRLTPGAGLWRRVSEPLERAWLAAAEQAADRVAIQSASALDLASALTKVARLASGASTAAFATSALIGSADLSVRVRRLLETPSPERGVVPAWIPIAAFMIVSLVIQLPPVSSEIHELFELLVRHG